MEELLEVLNYFPIKIKKIILDSVNPTISSYIEEIRIRNNKPIIVKISQESMIIEYVITTEDIEEIFQSICESSIYSYQNEICEGFITINGGHRIGITGNVVVDNGRIININYISSLNIRIAREIKNCSLKILNEIIDSPNDTIFNTIIVSPPGGGKTTVLRDIVRTISNGCGKISNKTIGIVDERGEIAAMYKGVPQNDIGIMTDVINNVTKEKGMKMLVRSMAPQIIVCDEIGSKEDVDAIDYALTAGVKGIFTAHGGNLNQIMNNKELHKLIENKKIEKIVILDSKNKGNFKEIYSI